MVTGHNIDFNVIPYQPVIQKKPAEKVSDKIQDNQFDKVFLQYLQESKVKFSAHAKNRIQQRKVDMDTDKIDRLNKGVAKAREKGSNETLLLMDDIAMVVSIRNDTVITIMSGESIKENVFTNIDSTVIV